MALSLPTVRILRTRPSPLTIYSLSLPDILSSFVLRLRLGYTASPPLPRDPRLLPTFTKILHLQTDVRVTCDYLACPYPLLRYLSAGRATPEVTSTDTIASCPVYLPLCTQRQSDSAGWSLTPAGETMASLLTRVTIPPAD